jgi:AcrR family transcriptional regulator
VSTNGKRAQAVGSPPYRSRRSKQGAPRTSPNASQPERLIAAMVELSADSGYHEVTVEQLCSQAGVSQGTFYEHFGSKEACFLAAYLLCGERIFGAARPLAANGNSWCDAARLGLEQLLTGLERDPEAGRVLFIEALGAGPAICEARERVRGAFERTAQELGKRTTSDAPGVDVPPTAVIGALRHIISRHLRTNSADRLPALLEDAVSWLSSYAVPAGAPPWSTSPAALLKRANNLKASSWKPETLPPGSHGLRTEVIARSHRTRLIQATAEVMAANGYQSAKVADIVAAARVARPVFYAHFPAGKGQAFLEAQDHPTQFILDTCADAYFSVDAWPERMWRMLETLLGLIVSNPAISHLRLVECYAAGPAAIRRAEEITRSFTLFLHEGYRYRAEAAALPRLCSQAIAGAIFEIVQRFAAAGEWAELPRHLPQLAYVAIAPFTGAQEAIAIVEQLNAREDTGRRPRSSRRRAGQGRSRVGRVR